MGIALSLGVVYELGRVTVPTFLDALRGAVTLETVDERAHEFARRVVRRTGMRLDVTRLGPVPTDRAYVYMFNHQSHMDVPVLYHVLPSPTVRMVAKKELFRVPVWGPAMRAAGYIRIDRSNREAAIASLQEASAQLARGVSIGIAPEGTRSRTGALGPLKKGGFHLALETRTPIVPVAIDGTREVLPSGGKSMRRGVRVRVTIGTPIPVDGRDLESLRDEVGAFLRRHVG